MEYLNVKSLKMWSIWFINIVYIVFVAETVKKVLRLQSKDMDTGLIGNC